VGQKLARGQWARVAMLAALGLTTGVQRSKNQKVAATPTESTAKAPLKRSVISLSPIIMR
jgi:hypothetical protein